MKTNSHFPTTKKTIQALWRLEKIILDTLDFTQVTQKICDGLLTELGYLNLGYRIIVLTLVDEEKKVLKRIALSQTKEAERAQQVSAVPFHAIEIPLSAKDNLLIKSMNENKAQITTNWGGLFTPILSEDQAQQNQHAAGIQTSMVFPISVKEKTIGSVIFSMIKPVERVSADEKELLRGFCDVIGLAVQNSRLYTSLEQTSLELKNANKKLKELDKLKDEFVSIASHELRTPMTAIRSYIWMVLAEKGGKINEKQRFYLERANSSTERLIKMVNDMLNVSRIESGRISLELNKVDLKNLCQEVIDEFKARVDELDLSLHLVTDECEKYWAVIDADKIKAVLINFISNSLKFTPKGGDITVTISKKNTTQEVSVADTGVGLSEESLKNLFKKFGLMKGSYRTNQDSSQGTGLGLYICKNIINMHHGKIWAQSDGENKGTTLSFSLPIYTPELLAEFEKKHAKSSHEVGII